MIVCGDIKYPLFVFADKGAWLNVDYPGRRR